MFRLYNGDYGGNEEFVKIQVLNIGFKLAVLYAKLLFAYFGSGKVLSKMNQIIVGIFCSKINKKK